jgi:hypothetical protein
MDQINGELESLGWGVELIDRKIFRSLLGFAELIKTRKTGLD